MFFHKQWIRGNDSSAEHAVPFRIIHLLTNVVFCRQDRPRWGGQSCLPTRADQLCQSPQSLLGKPQPNSRYIIHQQTHYFGPKGKHWGFFFKKLINRMKKWLMQWILKSVIFLLTFSPLCFIFFWFSPGNSINPH